MNAKDYYEKLPGMGAAFLSLGGVETLYLTPDYVLRLYRSGVTETAQRFYYKDIQAITSFKTKGSFQVNVISFMLVVICIALTFGFTAGPVWAVINLFVAGISLGILLINFFYGPTCVTTLRTAVNCQTLTSLRRTPKARRALKLLVARVQAAQEAIDPAKVAAYLENQAQGTFAELPVTQYSEPALYTKPREQAWCGTTTMHLAYFGLMILVATSCAFNFMFFSQLKFCLDGLIAIGVLYCGVAAGIRQRNSNISSATKSATNISLGINMVVYYLAVGMWAMFIQFEQMSQDPNFADLVEGFTSFSDGMRMTLSGIGLVTGLGCALWGLITLMTSPRSATPAGPFGPDAESA